MDHKNSGFAVVEADAADISAIWQVVQSSIRTVYPRYYPAEIVQFFSDLHSREHIAAAVEAKSVWVLTDHDGIVGTGSCSGGHITAVYVLPERRGQGLGSQIMDHLEAIASGEYSSVVLEASLPAVQFYEHRGYRTLRHDDVEAAGGVRLVFDVMEKRLAATTGPPCTPPEQAVTK